LEILAAMVIATSVDQFLASAEVRPMGSFADKMAKP
jgi:hypothetical protein